MTPRCKSGIAVASLAVAAFALSGAARAQYADPYGASSPQQPPSAAPYQSPAPPPPAQEPYPPPAAGPGVPPAPGPDYPYMWGGQRYCWYDAAWNGPGWYWCGYAYRRGYGWGGGYGWNGWVWRGGRGWRGGPHGGWREHERERFRH